MNDISLHTFLLSFPSVRSLVFPKEDERHIAGTEMKDQMVFEGLEECEDNERVAGFFSQYIHEIESRKEG